MLIQIEYAKLKELCNFAFVYGKNDVWESTFKADMADEIDKVLSEQNKP